MNKEKNKSPILYLTIQQLILHMYSKFQDSSFFPEKTVACKMCYGVTERRTGQIQYSPTFSNFFKVGL